jgi:hypothetical protein
MRRRYVETKLLHEPGQSRCLSLGQFQHQRRQRGGVHDRMRQRTLQPTAHQPRVEGIVAVLDEDRGLREAKKRASRVAELRRADQHRAVDVVALARVRVDGGAAVHQRVEEGEWSIEPKALGSHLEHQEGRIARGLDVERDELGFVERRLRANLRRINRDLLPGHRLDSAAWLEENRFGGHGASASARRAKRTSSGVTARRISAAAP